MKRLLEHLSSSLWPVPVAMLVVGALLVQGLRSVDAQLSAGEALQWWWLRSGNGDDARNLLSTLATAVITIASLVFSMTIVALSLAANQFGSRLVRSYMRDMRTKLSLGFFLLTVVYCLLALRMVSKDMQAGDVPHATVTLALVLGVSCVLVLVLFLHVVARSMVADEVVRRVAAELDEEIAALPPARRDGARPADEAELLPGDFEAGSRMLRSDEEGYIQQVHYERLVAFAAKQGLVLRLEGAAGDYMCRNGVMARVYPQAHCSDDLLREIRDAVAIGPERTPVQDLAFPVRHLVDVALRALSPGINDANTALVVIDRIRGALARLLESELPSGEFRDEAGTCRVVGHRRTHRQAFAAALHPIRDAAARQPLVILGMLQALAKLAEHITEPHHGEVIVDEARLIAEAAQLHPMIDSEREAIARALQAVRSRVLAFGRGAAPSAVE